MSAAETAPMPKPRSALKEEPPLLKAPSPDSLHPVPPQHSHPDPPKSKDKTPEPESQPAPSPVDSKTPPRSPVELEPEEDTPLVKIDVFEQILELDEDDDEHEFSRSMVWDYFDQAKETFATMDEAFAKDDLEQLSSLGHFLKGSSAALGLSRVQSTCEKIQHCGHRRDENNNKDLSPIEALQQMRILLKSVRLQYAEAEIWLKNFYGEGND
ncbi:unnamed protein product [Cyclocybe aegerita]|uniref:HPt domain-containing protein n=1 Tax=Cyclocybe aegerita TaxID=1973307 RepID=A0A8S0XG80_CYCAE|nr:unnamed protein product [Cyclocybe aegerita]